MAEMNLPVWHWPHVIDLAWRLQTIAEKKTGQPIDARTIELMYGPAVAESLIRTHGVAFEKLAPTKEHIREAYAFARGDERNLSLLECVVPAADNLAETFAKISNDPNVEISPKLGIRAQVICCLAHTLEPIARQTFQKQFIWSEVRRKQVFNDDDLDAWNGFELQVGMGILASIMHARQVVPDMTPVEFSTALLRKYGIPLRMPGASGDVNVYACHWCGTAPCSCGGGKSPARKVTYEDAAAKIYLGPADTQKGMYYSYAWTNTARGGVGYGPLRALIEVTVEKGAVLITENTLLGLERRFGPLLLQPQRHFAELINRFETPEKNRNATLSELADAVHWQYLYGPGFLDHTAGLAVALRRMATSLGVSLEMPLVPKPY